MREKQAINLYQDYLNKVKSEFEQKKKKMVQDKSMFNNFGQQMLFLPS